MLLEGATIETNERRYGAPCRYLLDFVFQCDHAAVHGRVPWSERRDRGRRAGAAGWGAVVGVVRQGLRFRLAAAATPGVILCLNKDAGLQTLSRCSNGDSSSSDVWASACIVFVVGGSVPTLCDRNGAIPRYSKLSRTRDGGGSTGKPAAPRGSWTGCGEP